MGFSTKGLWKTQPSTSIVSSVSISVSLEGAEGEGREEEGEKKIKGRENSWRKVTLLLYTTLCIHDSIHNTT